MTGRSFDILGNTINVGDHVLYTTALNETLKYPRRKDFLMLGTVDKVINSKRFAPIFLIKSQFHPDGVYATIKSVFKVDRVLYDKHGTTEG